MNRVNNLWGDWVHKFDVMIDRKILSFQKDIFSLLLKLCWSYFFIKCHHYKSSKCLSKVCCTIVTDNSFNGYRLEWRMLWHFQFPHWLKFWLVLLLLHEWCMIHIPVDEFRVKLHLLFMLQPWDHLPIFIFVICYTISCFSKINMKPFCRLSVVTICGSK